MSEGLAEGPYMVVRVGFEPATFQTQGTELPRSNRALSVVCIALVDLQSNGPPYVLHCCSIFYGHSVIWRYPDHQHIIINN